MAQQNQYKYSRLSMFLNLNAQDSNLSWSPILIPLFWPFMTGFSEVGQHHMAGKSACPTVTPLHALNTAQSALSFTKWRWQLSSFTEHIPLAINVLQGSKSVCIVTKINLHAFYVFIRLSYSIFTGVLHCKWILTFMILSSWQFYWSQSQTARLYSKWHLQMDVLCIYML